MMPPEIGAAAAYEAYRQIKYGTSVYNFLYEDYDRQHEALRAMAIAEGVCHYRSQPLGSHSHISRDPLLV
jgi:hypothetical protein